MNRCLFAALALIALAPSPALAFGTVNGLGQNAEHERITRAGLPEFGPETLDEVAGRGWRFGAVGAPDRPFRGLTGNQAAHCDGGDYLEPAPGAAPYPQTREQAQTALEACRTWIFSELERAVAVAAPLLQANDENTWLECRFDGRDRSAKCDVLQHFGLALHAAQDFYSHSNWASLPDSTLPISAQNPPGLGQEGRAPWLDPRLQEVFPAGLISHCYEGFPETFYCENEGRLRIKHSYLNNDNGRIENGVGVEGRTRRGEVSGNFARAVAAAVTDTADKWRYLEERFIATYGVADGRRIACIVRSDDWRVC